MNERDKLRVLLERMLERKPVYLESGEEVRIEDIGCNGYFTTWRKNENIGKTVTINGKTYIEPMCFRHRCRAEELCLEPPNPSPTIEELAWTMERLEQRMVNLGLNIDKMEQILEAGGIIP